MPTIFDFSWLISVGLLIGLSVSLTLVSERKNFSLLTLLIYMTIINAFIVSVDLLPIWLEVVLLLAIVGLTYLDVKSNKNRGNQ